MCLIIKNTAEDTLPTYTFCDDIYSTKITTMYYKTNCYRTSSGTHSTIRAKNIEYFSPSDVLTAALQITPNVTLYHQNMADFLIKMEK